MHLPQRKLLRLTEYDYSQNGCYFITICTHKKNQIFGKVIDGKVMLSTAGQIARDELVNVPSHYSMVTIDQFVVMPNHVHILLTIDHETEHANHIETERASPFPTVSTIIGMDGAAPIGSRDSERVSPFPTVSTIIGSYKSGVTNKIHQVRPGLSVWQKSFYDHIIRDETDYLTVCEYIEDNPFNWELDPLF